MNDVVIIGDIHLRDKISNNKEMPFFDAVQDVLNDIINNPEINNKDVTLILLGDLVESTYNKGNILEILVDMFLNRLKNKVKIVLEGNHDADIEHSVLDILRPLGVKVIKTPEEFVINNTKFLALPYYYPFSNDLEPMHIEYSKLKSDADFILHHVTDETVPKMKHVCDLSNLSGKRIGGHHHTANENYLGSISLNSITESGKTPYIEMIDTKKVKSERVALKKYLEYYVTTYPAVPEVTTKYGILKISQAPSTAEAIDFYTQELKKQEKDFYYSSILVEKAIDYTEKSKREQKSSLTEYLSSFFEKKKVKESIQDIMSETLQF